MTTPFRPLLIVLGSCLTTTALAQAPRDRSPADMIRQADTDGDGQVSRAEFIKARTARLEEAFERLDADGSGALDPEEIKAAPERLQPAFAEGRGDRGSRDRAAGPRPERGAWPRAERAESGGPASGAMAAGAFDRLDSDGDGRLSREEFEAGMTRMREFMQRRRGADGGGLGRPAPVGGGPEEGFRRPPGQD
jgi:Ca2+-binding EF-hand superfamily protein